MLSDDLEWLPPTAYWIVGINATGMSLGDAIVFPNGGRIISESTPHLSQIISGSFYIWEAGNSALISSGGFLPEGFTYAEIETLMNEPTPIVQSTEVPD